MPTSANMPSAGATRKAAMKAQSGVKAEREADATLAEAYPIGRGRQSKKAVVIYLHPLAKDQLDRIARAHHLTRQELGEEAFNLLFRSYQQKPIA